MNRDLLYIAGPAAAGKSTLMAVLTSALRRCEHAAPLPHESLWHSDQAGGAVAVEIGRRMGTACTGTDALGAHQHPHAVEWIQTDPHALVLAEGARLATIGFLATAADVGYRIHLAHLEMDAATQVARLSQRARRLSMPWLRGLGTRARGLATYGLRAGWHVVTLDATADPAQLVKTLHAEVVELGVLDRG